MAVSLLESANLSQDKLAPGVVEEMLTVSPMLQHYPFIEIVGNSLAINREDPLKMGSVNFRPVDGVWVASEAEFTQVSFNLHTLGEDCDVPTLIQRTRSNLNDQMATQMSIKSKLMAYKFEYQSIYGSVLTTHGFDGYHRLVTSDQQVHMGSGTTGAALTIAKLDELFDKIKGGRPSFIVMSIEVRRVLSEKLRGVASYRTERDDYGNYFGVWNETPLLASEQLLQTETISGDAYALPTTGDTSSIFAVRLGEGDGLCGIQNGGVETEFFEKLETKDASRTRIKWYCGQALYQTLALARLDGVTAEAMA